MIEILFFTKMSGEDISSPLYNYIFEVYNSHEKTKVFFGSIPRPDSYPTDKGVYLVIDKILDILKEENLIDKRVNLIFYVQDLEIPRKIMEQNNGDGVYLSTLASIREKLISISGKINFSEIPKEATVFMANKLEDRLKDDSNDQQSGPSDEN